MIFNLVIQKSLTLKSKRSQIKHMATISNTGFFEFFFLKRTQSNGCKFPKSWVWHHGKHAKILYFTFHIQRSPTQT